MNKKILEMIEQYEEERDFYGEVKEEDVEKVEQELGNRLPIQYREYVLKYGAGGICGVNIRGIEGELNSSMLNATNKYRRMGLKRNMIVVYDVGEFAVCLDINDTNSKAYFWHRDNSLVERYNSFDEFLEDYFQEGIDNY